MVDLFLIALGLGLGLCRGPIRIVLVIDIEREWSSIRYRFKKKLVDVYEFDI